MYENEEAVKLKDYIDILRRHFPLSLSIFITLFSLVIIYTFIRPRVYQAIAKVRVEMQQGSSFPIFLERSLGLPSPTLETQIQLAISRPSLAEAVEYIKMQSGGKQIVTVEEMAKEIQKGNIKLEVPRGSQLILIKVNSTSSEKAMLIANGLAFSIAKRDQQRVRKATVTARKFIEEQLYGNPHKGTKGIYQRLLEAEEKMRKFKEEKKIFSIEEEAKLNVQRLASLKGELEQVIANINAYKKNQRFLIDQLNKLQKTRIAGWVVGENPALAPLREELVTKEVKLLELQQKYTTNHPEVIAVKKQIEEIAQRIQAENYKKTLQENVQVDPINDKIREDLVITESELLKAEAKRKALQEFIAQLENRVTEIPQREVEMINLQREVQLLETLYTSLQQRYQEARIAEATTLGNIAIEETATLSTEPIYPNKRLNFLLGFLLAIALAIGSTFIAENIRDAVSSSIDLERILHTNLLAHIPLFAPKNPSSLILLEDPFSPTAESFRSLQYSLRFVSLDKPLKTILVTSAQPSEGKTTISANLALAFAMAGYKTIILDADLRRPRINEIFGINKEPGLTNVLIGDLELNRVVRETRIENLYVVTSGIIPPNPAELLGSERMKTILEELKTKADLIIIDAPIIMGIVDAVVLSAFCDGILMVVRYNSTSRSTLKETRRILETTKANILGAVLNGIDSRKTNYTYYYSEEGRQRQRKRKH